MNKQELRDRMTALPEPVTNLKPPHWEYWRWELWKHVVDGHDPNGFMGWPEIYHCMLQQHWMHVPAYELPRLHVEMGDEKAAAVIEAPEFYPKDLDPSAGATNESLNLIHQAYHLLSWQITTGQRITNLNTIVEFGGGYGAMSLVTRRMGFYGAYFIKDLPEFEILQKYFLSNCDPHSGVTFWSHGNVKHGDVPASLLIAGYSLSETDYAERDKFILDNPADSYLLWYSNKFVDYDNIEYFQRRLPAMIPDMNWKHWRVEHMPPETHYTVGWR